jgi:hypothetical protein
MVIRGFEKPHFWIGPVSVEETQAVKPRRFNRFIRNGDHDIIVIGMWQATGHQGFPWNLAVNVWESVESGRWDADRTCDETARCEGKPEPGRLQEPDGPLRHHARRGPDATQEAR